MHFPFPPKTEGCNCISLAELKNWRCLTRAERSRRVQARADWHGVEQPSRSRAELCSWRGAWPHGCLIALLFSQLCCITIELFHSTCCITIELFCGHVFSQLCSITTELFRAEKVPFFTANDHQLIGCSISLKFFLLVLFRFVFKNQTQSNINRKSIPLQY